MKISYIDLDSFDRQEYLAFINTIINYYYVQFNEVITINIGDKENE